MCRMKINYYNLTIPNAVVLDQHVVCVGSVEHSWHERTLKHTLSTLGRTKEMKKRATERWIKAEREVQV